MFFEELTEQELSIRPLPSKFGVGFFVMEEGLSEELTKGFQYEKVGRYHNYLAMEERWEWPVKYVTTDRYRMKYKEPINYIVDGFSPNLNKEFHVGHLRQLALANSLFTIFNGEDALRPVRFVALLGASLGVTKAGWDNWQKWTSFVGYDPDIYYDVVLPNDIVETHLPSDMPSKISIGEMESYPKVWDGPNGEVIVKRGDGSPLYAYHDLAFAKLVSPTHYITGAEQKEHFENLGFGEKHYEMGLVLGPDGKKMKSRSGDALSVNEALDMVVQNLDETSDPQKLAWNILAWNFLRTARKTNLKFEAEKWTKPDSGGMYISYTFARMESALYKIDWEAESDQTKAQIDWEIRGLASQYDYWRYRSMKTFDPSPIANFTLDLCRKLNDAYHKEKIVDGRHSFQEAMFYAGDEVLSRCMWDLGMFTLCPI